MAAFTCVSRLYYLLAQASILPRPLDKTLSDKRECGLLRKNIRKKTDMDQVCWTWRLGERLKAITFCGLMTTLWECKPHCCRWSYLPFLCFSFSHLFSFLSFVTHWRSRNVASMTSITFLSIIFTFNMPSVISSMSLSWFYKMWCCCGQSSLYLPFHHLSIKHIFNSLKGSCWMSRRVSQNI